MLYTYLLYALCFMLYAYLIYAYLIYAYLLYALGTELEIQALNQLKAQYDMHMVWQKVTISQPFPIPITSRH